MLFFIFLIFLGYRYLRTANGEYGFHLVSVVAMRFSFCLTTTYCSVTSSVYLVDLPCTRVYTGIDSAGRSDTNPGIREDSTSQRTGNKD
jgi:hypothetical protein